MHKNAVLHFHLNHKSLDENVIKVLSFFIQILHVSCIKWYFFTIVQGRKESLVLDALILDIQTAFAHKLIKDSSKEEKRVEKGQNKGRIGLCRPTESKRLKGAERGRIDLVKTLDKIGRKRPNRPKRREKADRSWAQLTSSSKYKMNYRKKRQLFFLCKNSQLLQYVQKLGRIWTDHENVM